ncbi:M12 family metallopeptidase [Pedobacter miscanthi]|uniref:Peptidase M12A domain-containing protein n=1 Tax=Pedobacter miscanthi TaxID=2259170 RepID=A0A366LDD1_9SPHI|nr:M12 family metallopeptidase [Pedobacter miscanthi]RBQ11891.1 hypothetical protein DRW42_01050 [Pedobacter miscanthi]
MKTNQFFKNLAKTVVVMIIIGLAACKKNNEKEVVKNQKENLQQTVMHDFTIDGNKMTIKEENGEYYFADDIILGAQQFNLLKRLNNKELSTQERSLFLKDTKRWPNGIVYYKLSLGTSNTYALQAMQKISSVSPVRFVERTNQPNYIEVIKSDGNNSPLGMQGGRQELRMINHTNAGIIAHEFMHALGVQHEHQRPDRDNFVKVYLENVDPNFRYAFNKVSSVTSKTLGTMDLGSIMMYGSKAFSINGKMTITLLNGSGYTDQVNNLSAKDIAGLDDMY